MANHTVFISYRRRTGSTMARMIYDRLRLEKNYTVFLDVETLTAGNFRQRIEAQMALCDTFILILTADSISVLRGEGDPVLQELQAARKLGLSIIPVTSEDFAWPDIMPPELADLKDYNAIPYVQVYSESFFERLYSFMDSAGEEAPDFPGRLPSGFSFRFPRAAYHLYDPPADAEVSPDPALAFLPPAPDNPDGTARTALPHFLLLPLLLLFFLAAFLLTGPLLRKGASGPEPVSAQAQTAPLSEKDDASEDVPLPAREQEDAQAPSLLCADPETGDLLSLEEGAVLHAGKSTFSMGGDPYGNGITLSCGYSRPEASFVLGLEGKYKEVSFLLGHVDGSDFCDTSVSLYLDGTLCEQLTVESMGLPKTVRIPVDGVSRMKVTAGRTAPERGDIYPVTGFGEITAFPAEGPESTAADAGRSLPLLRLYPPYASSEGMRTASRESPFSMGGRTYEDGLILTYAYGRSDAFFLLNLRGGCRGVSFELGHVDGTSLCDVTVSAYLDGKPCGTWTAGCGDGAREVFIPAAGAKQLKIIASRDSQGKSGSYPETGFGNLRAFPDPSAEDSAEASAEEAGASAEDA